MKIVDVIEKVNILKPNTIDDEMKFGWLYELDKKLFNEIWNNYLNEERDFEQYVMGQDENVELQVEEPYTEIYVYWLFSKIDYFQQEHDLYANDMIMYNSEYEEYSAWYLKNHEHKPTEIQVGW